MSGAAILGLALVAAYGVMSLLLSCAVAIVWHTARDRRGLASRDLLALRLLPSVGALLLTLTVVLPAFLIYEPFHEVEEVGPLLVVLVAYALATLGLGLWRGWRAYTAAWKLLRHCSPTDCWDVMTLPKVDIVDVPAPIVAVVGGWRPRIIVAKTVVAACSALEFRQVIAHEVAHLTARDNLKLLLLVASPDVLGCVPFGAALIEHWRAAAEFEADERATGLDRHKRLALAAALVKVARLSTGTDRLLPLLSMRIALDDVAGRVRRLIAPASHAAPKGSLKTMMMVALLFPAITVPLYAFVHQFVEALVTFGR
jgi:Zn-dependent protease with chaperone function